MGAKESTLRFFAAMNFSFGARRSIDTSALTVTKSKMAVLSMVAALCVSACGAAAKSDATTSSVVSSVESSVARDGQGAEPGAQPTSDTGHLVDGEILTKSVMDQVYEDAVECLSGAGYTASFEVLYGRVYRLTADGDGYEGQSATEMDQAYDTCTQRVSELSPIWDAQNQPTDAEQELAAQRLGDCVADYGIAITGPGLAGSQELIARLTELEELPANSPERKELDVLHRCIDEYNAAAGTRP